MCAKYQNGFNIWLVIIINLTLRGLDGAVIYLSHPDKPKIIPDTGKTWFDKEKPVYSLNGPAVGRPFYPDAESPYKVFDTVAEYSPFNVISNSQHPPSTTSKYSTELKGETRIEKDDAIKYSDALDSDTYYGIKGHDGIEDPQKIRDMESENVENKGTVMPMDETESNNEHPDIQPPNDIVNEMMSRPTPQTSARPINDATKNEISPESQNKNKDDDATQNVGKGKQSEVVNSNHEVPLKALNQKPPPIHIHEGGTTHVVEKGTPKPSSVMPPADTAPFSVTDVINSEKAAINFAKQFGDAVPTDRNDEAANQNVQQPQKDKQKVNMEPVSQEAAASHPSQTELVLAQSTPKPGSDKKSHHRVTIDTDTGEIVDEAIVPVGERYKEGSKYHHVSGTEEDQRLPHQKSAYQTVNDETHASKEESDKDIQDQYSQKTESKDSYEKYRKVPNKPFHSDERPFYKPHESNRHDHRPNTRNGPYLSPNYKEGHESSKESDERKDNQESNDEKKFNQEDENREYTTTAKPSEGFHENSHRREPAIEEQPEQDTPNSHHQLYNDIMTMHPSHTYIDNSHSHTSYMPLQSPHPPQGYMDAPHAQIGNSFHGEKENENENSEERHSQKKQEGDELEYQTEKVKNTEDTNEGLTHEQSEPKHVDASNKDNMYSAPAPTEEYSNQHESPQTIIQNHYHKHVHHHNHIHIHSGQGEDRPKNGYRHIKLRDMDTVSHSAEKSMQEDHQNTPKAKAYFDDSGKNSEKETRNFPNSNEISQDSSEEEPTEKPSPNFEKEATSPYSDHHSNHEENDQQNAEQNDEIENQHSKYEENEESPHLPEHEEPSFPNDSSDSRFSLQHEKTGEVISKSSLNKDDDSDPISSEFYNLLDGVKKPRKTKFQTAPSNVLDHIHETETFDNNNLPTDLLEPKGVKRNSKKHKKPSFAMEPKILKQHEIVEPSYMVHEDPRGDGLGTGVIDGPEIASPVDLTSSKRAPNNSTKSDKLLNDNETQESASDKPLKDDKEKDSAKTNKPTISPEEGHEKPKIPPEEVLVNKHKSSSDEVSKESNAVDKPKTSGEEGNNKESASIDKPNTSTEEGNVKETVADKSKSIPEEESHKETAANKKPKLSLEEGMSDESNNQSIEKVKSGHSKEENDEKEAPNSHGKQVDMYMKSNDLKKFASKILNSSNDHNSTENLKNYGKEKESEKNVNEKDVSSLTNLKENEGETPSPGGSNILSTIQQHLQSIEMDDLNKIQEEIKEIKSKKLLSKPPVNTKAFSRTSSHLDLDVKSEKYKIPEKQQTLPLNNPGHPDDMNGVKLKSGTTVAKKMPLLNPQPEENHEDDALLSRKKQLVPERNREENPYNRNKISHANLTGTPYKVKGNESTLDLEPFVVASKYKPLTNANRKTINIKGETRSLVRKKEAIRNTSSEKITVNENEMDALDLGDTPDEYTSRMHSENKQKIKIKKSILAKPLKKNKRNFKESHIIQSNRKKLNESKKTLHKGKKKTRKFSHKRQSTMNQKKKRNY